MRDRAPGRVVLVLDENLSGKSIVEGLRAGGVPVKPQTDFMERGVSDPEVFAALAPHADCYLLTKDSQFHRRPGERAALIRHRVGAFVITSHKNKTGPELVALIRESWPKIERFARAHCRPFIAKILASGRVEQVV